jgi:hypothetical protein
MIVAVPPNTPKTIPLPKVVDDEKSRKESGTYGGSK